MKTYREASHREAARMAHTTTDKGEDMYKWEWKLWEVRREEHPDRTILTLYRGEEPVDSVTTYARYTTMCEPLRTVRLIEPDVAARLVEKYLGEGYNVVWKGRSWEVVP